MQRRLPLFLIIYFLILTSCTSSQGVESHTTAVKKLDLAFVEGININKISSEEIILVANGQLPNSCSKVEKSDVEHTGDAIIVSIYTSQSESKNCVNTPVNFDQEIKIELSSYHEASYTIIVNGISTTAEVPQASNSKMVLQSTPSPSLEQQQNTEDIASGDSQSNAEQVTQTTPPQPTLQPTQTSQATETTGDNQQESSAEPQTTPTTVAAQPTSLPTESSTSNEECSDKAAFYADVTVPDNTIFKPGDNFTKTWRVRNEGTCTWNSSYHLVFESGEIMNGALSNPMPDITPGEIADISIDLKAPARWGQYTGNWQFENEKGQRFGVGAGGHDFIWVQIFVDSPAPAPQSNPPSSPPSDTQPEQPAQGSASCAVEPNPAYEQQVLTLINNARITQGLKVLNLQSQLSNAAYTHSSDMACNDFVGHTGSDASSWYDRVSAQGYSNYNSARENIYVGDPTFGGTPEGAFNWWMNSQVHRDNILNPDVSEIGIGYVYYANSSYGGYYTVVFARP